MNKLIALTTIAIFGLVACAQGALAQDDFKKLSGAQIRAKLSGMELTDQSHWSEVYEPNGRLRREEMGRKEAGSWRVQNDQLCTAIGKDGGSYCYEVWMSGKNVRLKTAGSTDPPFDSGVLDKPNQ
jgi:hypothetical protein